MQHSAAAHIENEARSSAEKILLSVVSPVYQAQETVLPLCEALVEILEKITPHFEIVLPEDGSRDRSWDRIVEACKRDSRIRGVKLSRNFGQHKAISAGLQAASGDWVVVMDCDLQDPPQEIPRLYAEALKGYDIVQARRENRQDSSFKKFSSRMFYKVLSYLTDTKLDPAVANFGIYSRKVIDQLNEISESVHSFPLFVRWVGFPSITLAVAHQERHAGRSSYNFGRSLSLALNLMISFSNKPLRLLAKLGLLIACVAFLVGLSIFVVALNGKMALGWPSLMVSIWFLAGVVIFAQGILGIYIAKTFEEAKGRKPFIVESTLNLTPGKDTIPR